MLIGAHVSTAGGLAKTVERGVATTSDAIQVFNQSPRMWRPTAYDADDFAAFHRAIEGSRVESVTIHAVYLLNTTTTDRSLRRKTLASLTQALALGDGIGAAGVVIHAGSRKGAPLDGAIKRSGRLVREALERTESCPILFENTAGTEGPVGRTFDELARLVEAADGEGRIGVCIDCCHLFASGYEIREPEQLAGVVDELDDLLGLERLRCLHVNDSAVPLGSNRDRHANLGEGELGRRGIRTFLSEPRFEGLPALLEVPGPDKRGPDKAQVQLAKRLRREGLRRRSG
jgi:deoxyribonuclease IV